MNDIEIRLFRWYSHWLYFFALYLRGWKGPGTPYPYRTSQPDPVLIGKEMDKYQLLLRVINRSINTVQCLNRMIDDVNRVLTVELEAVYHGREDSPFRGYLADICRGQRLDSKITADISRTYLTGFGSNTTLKITPLIDEIMAKMELSELVSGYKDRVADYFQVKDMVSTLGWPVDLLLDYVKIDSDMLRRLTVLYPSPSNSMKSNLLLDKAIEYLTQDLQIPSKELDTRLTKFIVSQYPSATVDNTHLINHRLVTNEGFWLRLGNRVVDTLWTGNTCC